MSAEFWKWSATRTAKAIASKEVSSREVTASVLKRIEEVNGKINAVVDVLADRAFVAADQADTLLAQGIRLGPLHGVPVTVKDNVDQAGCATTNGIVAAKHLIATEDSPVVANWTRAGAVLIGRTNTPAFSFRWFSDNDVHGRTLNPWDSSVTPGGSSGGAAAAVATGLGFLAHGNDLGGSIRYPAYCCGVAGIRPTIGRAPSFNRSAVRDRPFTSQMMGAQGVLARSVADLHLGLVPMAAKDHRDPLWTPAPWSFEESPGSQRVAVCFPGTACDPDVTDSLREAADALSHAGYEVEEQPAPHLEEATLLWHAFVIGEARISNMLADIDRLGDDRVKLSIGFHEKLAPALSLESFSRALIRRNAILRDWLSFLDHYSLVLMPTSLRKPFLQDLDQRSQDTYREILDAQAPLLGTAVLGLPALSVPTGVRAGLPSGVQVVAGRFREDQCFAAGEAIEREFRPQVPIDPRRSE